MADPESYIKKTDTPELERNRGVEKSDQAAQNLGNTLEQKKVENLAQKEKKVVTKIITELSQLRNDPVMLTNKLHDPVILDTLRRNDIPVEYVISLIDDMRRINQNGILGQIDDGNIGPAKTELIKIVGGLNKGYHELFKNLGERSQEAVGPLSEDAPIIAQLREEVQEAKAQTKDLLMSFNKLA